MAPPSLLLVLHEKKEDDSTSIHATPELDDVQTMNKEFET
jgi:hypothetical protein